MTTVHSTAASQKTVDGRSERDWRGGRSVNNNIIPASTGAAKSVTKVIPTLDGKLTGMAFRVPMFQSLISWFASRKAPLTKKSHKYSRRQRRVKNTKESSPSPKIKLSRVIGLVAHTYYFFILDAQAGLQLNDNFVKLVAWYNNEWGYSCRVCDVDQTSSLSGSGKLAVG
jgi:glyceraldehyde 3-phosphate dehydrogenase